MFRNTHALIHSKFSSIPKAKISSKNFFYMILFLLQKSQQVTAELPKYYFNQNQTRYLFENALEDIEKKLENGDCGPIVSLDKSDCWYFHTLWFEEENDPDNGRQNVSILSICLGDQQQPAFQDCLKNLIKMEEQANANTGLMILLGISLAVLTFCMAGVLFTRGRGWVQTRCGMKRDDSERVVPAENPAAGNEERKSLLNKQDKKITAQTSASSSVAVEIEKTRAAARCV